MSEPRPIAPAPMSAVALVGHAGAGPVGEAVRCDGVAAFEESFGEAGPLADAARAFFANDGRAALAVRSEEAGDLAHALDGEPLGVVHLALGRPSAEQLARAARWCRAGGALLVADVPQAGSVDEAVAFARELAELAGEAAADVALYFPHLRGSSAGGAVAAIVARTEPWRAPAGMDAVIAGGASLTLDLRRGEIERLTEAGVNALRTLPDGATVVWGARTASSDSEWKYVNVRRYFAFLERSIDTGTQWAVFEPNDQPLWAAVRDVVGDFLIGQWRDGALPGSTPAEAFFVRCDRTTMTAADIAAGELLATIGVAMIKPAEFIMLRIRHRVQPPP